MFAPSHRCNSYAVCASRKHVTEIISAILCRDESLHYFQGFHDVASSFLLILEDNALTFAVLEACTSYFFSDFMREDFMVFSRSMSLIMTLLSKCSPRVYSHLSSIPHFEPFFVTSWIITWFSHEMDELTDIAQIFDVMLTSHPLYAYYLSAQVNIMTLVGRCTLTARSIPQLIAELSDTLLEQDADMASVHCILLEAPLQLRTRLQEIVAGADKLFADYPPEYLVRHCDPSVSALLAEHK